MLRSASPTFRHVQWDGSVETSISENRNGWKSWRSRAGLHLSSAYFMSEAFMLRLIGLFADDIRAQGCGIDLDKVYLAQRAESRAETETPLLSEIDDPNALFIRFDNSERSTRLTAKKSIATICVV